MENVYRSTVDHSDSVRVGTILVKPDWDDGLTYFVINPETGYNEGWLICRLGRKKLPIIGQIDSCCGSHSYLPPRSHEQLRQLLVPSVPVGLRDPNDHTDATR